MAQFSGRRCESQLRTRDLAHFAIDSIKSIHHIASALKARGQYKAAAAAVTTIVVAVVVVIASMGIRQFESKHNVALRPRFVLTRFAS